ncbi:MAG TPA: hypothetical protein PLC54_04410 [Spirochaetales bacterium]|nr:hypothetical protein [Spirochaetales bacterium]
MDTAKLDAFISATATLRAALDRFVDEQRTVSQAVRVRKWAELEQAMAKAGRCAAQVSAAETGRDKAWYALLESLALPPGTTVARASMELPVELRASLSDAYRELRLSAMRARIENQALETFVGVEGSTLTRVIEELYPMRKGRIYGKSGKTKEASPVSMVLNTAF